MPFRRIVSPSSEIRDWQSILSVASVLPVDYLDEADVVSHRPAGLGARPDHVRFPVNLGRDHHVPVAGQIHDLNHDGGSRAGDLIHQDGVRDHQPAGRHCDRDLHHDSVGRSFDPNHDAASYAEGLDRRDDVLVREPVDRDYDRDLHHDSVVRSFDLNHDVASCAEDLDHRDDVPGHERLGRYHEDDRLDVQGHQALVAGPVPVHQRVEHDHAQLRLVVDQSHLDHGWEGRQDVQGADSVVILDSALLLRPTFQELSPLVLLASLASPPLLPVSLPD